MGIVFEALHVRLRQRVAVKMLLPEFAKRGDVVARFDREARAAAQLRNAHVARVLDVDMLPEGAPYLVMEYLQGRDLSAELAARGPLPIAEAVDYVCQACDAMAEAHALGIVHRDLKPGNLFLTDEGGRRTVKVLDFGISKVADDNVGQRVTATFSALGTALYMSPEQVRSAKHVDARSDVWALGVILYELLTGRTPFEGESATAVAASIVADPLPSPRTFRPELPSALETAVMIALEKDRERRFRSAPALAQAIAGFGLAGTPATSAALAQSAAEKSTPFSPSPIDVLGGTVPYFRPGDANPPGIPASNEQAAASGPATAAGWTQSTRRSKLSRTRIALGILALGVAGAAIVFIARTRPASDEPTVESAATGAIAISSENAQQAPTLVAYPTASLSATSSSAAAVESVRPPSSSSLAPQVVPRRTSKRKPDASNEPRRTTEPHAKPIPKREGRGLPDDPG
jgi:serine/threonine-protein kinase